MIHDRDNYGVVIAEANMRLILGSKNSHPPIFPISLSALLAPVRDRKPSQEDMNLLIGDSQLIIVAGG